MADVNDSRADDVLRKHADMESDRAVFDSHWREIEQYFSYQGQYFNNANTTQGQKSTARIFDMTGPLAAERFAAAVTAMISPRTELWHGLKASDDGLKRFKSVRDWMDAARDNLFAARYAPAANFSGQSHTTYYDIGLYGTGCLFVDDVIGRSLLYRAVHLSEVYVSDDAAGRVDTVHRVQNPRIRHLAERFGLDVLPPKLRDLLEKGKGDSRVPIIHCVRPNAQYNPGRGDMRGKLLESYYVLPGERAVLQEGGYRTMPYCIGRYTTSARETYGRGPGMLALPEVKMLNDMRKTIIRAAQKTVEPPLLAYEDSLMHAFDNRAGAINFGGLDASGNQLVKPLMSAARVDIGMDQVAESRRVINSVFHIDLFQVLVDKPGNMTAFEAAQRAQEKGQLLGPTMGRIQSDLIETMIERELDIMAHAGQLPKMPREMIEAGMMQGRMPVGIEHTSPLNLLQRASQSAAIMRAFQTLGPLYQIDNSVLDLIDIEEAAKIIIETEGVPSRVLRDDDQVQQSRDQRDQQQQAASLLQAAPQAASAAKDIAQAQQIARGMPGGLLGLTGTLQ